MLGGVRHRRFAFDKLGSLFNKGGSSSGASSGASSGGWSSGGGGGYSSGPSQSYGPPPAAPAPSYGPPPAAPSHSYGAPSGGYSGGHSGAGSGAYSAQPAIIIIKPLSGGSSGAGASSSSGGAGGFDIGSIFQVRPSSTKSKQCYSYYNVTFFICLKFRASCNSRVVYLASFQEELVVAQKQALALVLILDGKRCKLMWHAL